MSARVLRRPPKRAEDATAAERLAWLETAVDLVFDELSREADERSRTDERLRTSITAVQEAQRGEVAKVIERLDEARIPERLEWWGAVFVGVSVLLGLLEALTSIAA